MLRLASLRPSRYRPPAMNTVTRLLMICLAVAALAAPAQAGKYLDWRNWTTAGNAVNPQRNEEWHINLALGAGIAPEYLGGEDYTLVPLPLAEVEYRGTVFISTQRGLGYALVKTRQTRIGALASYDFGRNPGDSNALTGMPVIDGGVQLGLFMDYYTGPVRLSGEVQKEISGGHDGVVLRLDAAYGGRIGRNTSIILGGVVHLVDDTYNDSYFTVLKQHATPQRKQFTAGGGLRDYALYGQMVVELPNRFYIGMDARVTFLAGDASESPIVGSDTQFFGGALLGYRF